MPRFILAVLSVILLCIGSLAAQTDVGPEAAGIKLPVPFNIANTEQFVDVTAECAGPVRWIVWAGQTKLKYKMRDANTITIGIPSTPTVITIYAVGIVDSKLTDAVKTELTVTSTTPAPAPAPTPTPAPAPEPAPVAGGVKHVTIIEDATQRTPAFATILDSPTLGQRLAPPNYILRVMSIKSPLIGPKGLQTVIDKGVAKYGAKPAWLIVQDNTGKVLSGGAMPMPATEDALIKAATTAR